MNDEIQRLIDARLNGTLDQDGCHALSEWIARDKANAIEYARQALLHAQIHEAFACEAPTVGERDIHQVETTDAKRPPKTTRDRTTKMLLRGKPRWALAATVLLFATAAAMYFAFAHGRFVTVVDLDGELLVGDDIGQVGHEYAGGAVELRGGSAELKLSSGVIVNLNGRTRLNLTGPMNASMSQGSVTFDCPPRAKGYAVRLPGGADVVDLSTRFTVEVVSEKQSTVRVLKGEVEVVQGATRQSAAANTSVAIIGDRIVPVADSTAIFQSDPDFLAWDAAKGFKQSTRKADGNLPHGRRWNPIADTTALSGRALDSVQDNQKGGNIATWSLVFADAGVYHLYVRHRIPDKNFNTIWIPTDFGRVPQVSFGGPGRGGSWNWREVGRHETSKYEISSYNVSRRQVDRAMRFSIGVREAGYVVDRFVLHKSSGLDAATLDRLHSSNSPTGGS